MEFLVRDARYALRQLRRSPVFAATAVLTLALGIGANTAIFTVVQSVLLTPLPYRSADRIVAINTVWQRKDHVSPRVTGPDLVDIRSQSSSIEAISYYQGGELGVQMHDHAAFTGVSAVNAGFARVFGVTPDAGRWFTDAEAKRSAVVSETFARNNFGSVPAAMGQVLRVAGQPLEIVGVLPAGFNFPNHTQVWMCYPWQPESMERTAFNYQAVAKLKHGVPVASAQAELDGIAMRLETAYPESNKDKGFQVVPLQEQLAGHVRPMLLLLMSTVGLILLIACVNVTHLYLARSINRQRELAVRIALGCSRRQLTQVLVVESLLLSIAGGVLGAMLAVPVVRLLVSLAPAELPRAGEIHLNPWVLAFTAGISLLATAAASLMPARQAARVDPIEALKQDSSRGLVGPNSARLRNGLVIAEVAAAFVLAVGAALLVRTMLALQSTDSGYKRAGLLVVDADAPATNLEQSLDATRKFAAIFAELKAVPGVEDVAGVMGLPTGKYGSNGYYSVDRLSVDTNNGAQAVFSLASPDYFQTMGIPLLRGREFAPQDSYNAPFVAVISESLAKRSFPGRDPIGRQIQCGLDAPGKWMTVVGIVRGVRQDSPAELPGPALYMPLAQHPFMATQINIVVRTGVAPGALIDTVHAKIQHADPAIATRFTTMDAMVGESMDMQRFRSILVSLFAAVGLLLAVLGVYGTVAYTVAQRTFEIGLRMTFGARRQSILKMVLGQALVEVAIGIGIGLVVSLVASRWIAGMLIGVSPTDPVSLAAAAGLLLVTATGAALLPARKAASVEPMLRLREM